MWDEAHILSAFDVARAFQMRQAGSDLAGRKAARGLDRGGRSLGALEQKSEDESIGRGAEGRHGVAVWWWR